MYMNGVQELGRAALHMEAQRVACRNPNTLHSLHQPFPQSCAISHRPVSIRYCMRTVTLRRTRASSWCELPTDVHNQLRALGLTDNAFSALKDNPDLQTHVESSLSILTTLASGQRVRTLLLANPELLCVPLGIWLDFLTAYGMSRADFLKLLASHPQLFISGSLFNAGSVMAYLQSLGLSPRNLVSSVLPQCGDLLLRDLHTHIVPAVTALQRELGLGQAELRDLLYRCPRLIAFETVSEIPQRLDTLCEVGFSREVARQVLADNAALLSADLHAMLRVRLAFFTADCGLSADQAAAQLIRCPEILALTVPNLARKWRFLTERMHGGCAQVLAYPTYWSKNLLLHIGPRFSYLIERLAPSGLHSSEVSGGMVNTAEGQSHQLVSFEYLDLRLLLDGDDAAFVGQVRSSGGQAALFTLASGCADEKQEDGIGTGGADDGAPHESAVDLADYESFRVSWLEREGAKWTGVRMVGMTDSW